MLGFTVCRRLFRTASRTNILDLLGTLATLAAAVLLTGKLRKVHDICRISSDTQLIGAVMLGIIDASFWQIPPPNTRSNENVPRP